MMHPAINKWFGINAEEYSMRVPSEELQCWTPALRARLQPRPLHELAQEWATRRQQEEEGRLDQSLAEWRKRFVVGARHDVQGGPRQGRLETAVMISHKGALPIILTVINAPRKEDTEVRAVVCVAQHGREAFLKNRAEAIVALAQQGCTVVLADLPGTGETRSGDSRGKSSYATSVSSLAQLFGTSLLELRLYALCEVLAHLQTAAGDRKLRVALWGDSFAAPNRADANLRVPHDAEPFPTQGEPLGGLLALCAPLLTDVPIAGAYVHGGLVSYRSLLDGPFLHIPHDAIEPGFLAKMDLDEAARRFAPRPLKMEALIDGLNVQVDAAKLGAHYRRTAASYQGHPGRLQLQTQRSTDAEIAAWLMQVLTGG